jgi:Na+/H+-dicarboxylate symporter
MDTVNTDLAISLLKRRFASEYSDMIVIPITQSELICTIASIKNKNSLDTMVYPIKFLHYVENFSANHLPIFSIYL